MHATSSPLSGGKQPVRDLAEPRGVFEHSYWSWQWAGYENSSLMGDFCEAFAN